MTHASSIGNFENLHLPRPMRTEEAVTETMKVNKAEKVIKSTRWKLKWLQGKKEYLR